jgi:FAD/FMN-containing dehydrogenase
MKISEIRESLKRIISGDVLWEKEVLRYYSVDASYYQIFPKIVVVAKNEEDVITLVRFANKVKMSVTVRGAGTGLVGSSLNNGIVLDLRNLDFIKMRKDTVEVGSGIHKGMLDMKLKEKNKFFAPNPSVGPYCSIGGMLGNNASGSRSLKYGSTIDNVEEITLVSGTGERITLPENKKLGKKISLLSNSIISKKFPSVSKNSSGYRLDSIKAPNDAHKVIVGSEGTLGIILSAKLKIRDIPNKRILFVIEYQSPNCAAKDCEGILLTYPSAVEFVDKVTLKHIPQKFDKKTKCILFLEYDSEIKTRKEKLRKTVTGRITYQTLEDLEIKRWVRYRDSALYYSLKSIKGKNRVPHVIEDAAVSVGKLGQLFSIIEKTNQKFKTRSIMYGHAGNGNIHVRLIYDQENVKKIRDIARFYFDMVIDIGGTISGEHGDGLARTEFVKNQYGPKNYRVFKRLKNLLDPNNILNPGKIIGKKSTVFENLENL